jgi:ferredoxin-NADP reductase
MSVPVKIPTTVEKVIKHTDAVCSYIFKPLKQCPRFKPGQFLHLAIDPYDPSFQWPESRVFSIASSPTRSDNIKITISIKGKFTSRMFNEIQEGKTIWLKLPYGDFTFNNVEKPLVLIAGGTGITPFISYLEYCIDKHIKRKIHLYYGVRSENLIIHNNIIEDCEKTIKDFKKHIYVEKIHNSEKYRKGLLDIYTIYEESTINNPEYYLSGPLPMVQNFKEYLLEKHVSERSIFVDQWE